LRFSDALAYIMENTTGALDMPPAPFSWTPMISQKAKYALRALVALARAESGSMMIGEIAAQQKIPRKFLEQILLELKRDGIVASRRGKLGGYGLLKPATEITFGQVLRLIDGPLAPLPCLSKIAYRRCADCADEENCEIRRVFFRVADSARSVLDHQSLADAIAQPSAAAAAAFEEDARSPVLVDV
jgi:Rrf2 family protein